VPANRNRRWASILGGVVGCLYVAFGFAEVATHLDEPASLIFWISSLWGGGALVLYGTFGRPEVATRLVVAGSLLGFLATLWTLVIPALATALVFISIRNSGRGRDAAAS
jgi:hypothetical protein